MTTVAVLGTGIMGAPMARHLLDAGHEVRVWNRTAEKAAPLGDAGATIAETPRDAVAGTDVFVTMLSNGDAVRAVVTGGDGALAGADEHTIWLQMSTVGEEIDGLVDLAAEHGVTLVDAPVLGTREPAEQGALTVIAAGDQAQVTERCAPVFDAVGVRTVWVGDVGAASRMKLVVNDWLVGLVGALAESIALAERLGVDPSQFLDIIDGGPIGPPYARIKGDAMIAGDHPPSFPLRLALKDARLVVAAAERVGLAPSVTAAVVERFAAADAAGHGDEDMAAVHRAYAH